MEQTGTPPLPPTISLRANLWVIIPIGALIAAILTANLFLLNYVHIFCSILWTGTDIFMAFLLGPVLRNVSLSTRREVISWPMPKMVFFMPTISAVTTTASYFLASKMGLITLGSPTVYWLLAVLVIVTVMMMQGLGILLSINLRVYFELRKGNPDMPKIQKLMKKHVKVVAIQSSLQFTIIFIMTEFATGFSLHL
jgi:uncharacterized membrane protein